MEDEEFTAAVEETCSPSAKMIESLRKQIEGQQARIAAMSFQKYEIMGVLSDIGNGSPFDDICRKTLSSVVTVLSGKDADAALAAHDAKVKRAALLDLAGMFEQAGWDDVPGRLRRMAEGEK